MFEYMNVNRWIQTGIEVKQNYAQYNRFKITESQPLDAFFYPDKLSRCSFPLFYANLREKELDEGNVLWVKFFKKENMSI